MDHMLRTVEDYIETRKGVRVVINTPDTAERLAMLYAAHAIAVQWTGTSS